MPGHWLCCNHDYMHSFFTLFSPVGMYWPNTAVGALLLDRCAIEMRAPRHWAAQALNWFVEPNRCVAWENKALMDRFSTRITNCDVLCGLTRPRIISRKEWSVGRVLGSFQTHCNQMFAEPCLLLTWRCDHREMSGSCTNAALGTSELFVWLQWN